MHALIAARACEPGRPWSCFNVSTYTSLSHQLGVSLTASTRPRFFIRKESVLVEFPGLSHPPPRI